MPKNHSRPVYDLRGGVRGKYATTADSLPSPVTRRVWAPLVDFRWAGDSHCVAEDTSIAPSGTYRGYESRNLDASLSERDRALCRSVAHWLCVSLPSHHELSAKESVNSLLLALWIVRPTKAQVTLRFEESEGDVPEVSRVLDRFQWIQGQVSEDVRDEDLRSVGDLLPRVRAAYAQRGRLRNALVLTFRGCVSIDWQTAFICWSAALEALLTYERGPQLTDRLARAYAKLTVEPSDAMAVKIKNFKTVYDIRSAIMHGRSYDRDGSERNLEDLAACSNLLRHVWRIVLSSGDVCSILESADDVRRRFFDTA